MDQVVAMQARSAAADKVGQHEDRLEHIELSIGGMNCPHCPAAVEKALIAVAGVHKAQVNLANALASVDFDPMWAKDSGSPAGDPVGRLRRRDGQDPHSDQVHALHVVCDAHRARSADGAGGRLGAGQSRHERCRCRVPAREGVLRDDPQGSYCRVLSGMRTSRGCRPNPGLCGRLSESRSLS